MNGAERGSGPPGAAAQVPDEEVLQDVLGALNQLFAEGIDHFARRGVPVSKLVLIISDGSMEPEGPDVRTLDQMRPVLVKLRRKRFEEVQAFLKGQPGAVRMMLLSADGIKLSWVDPRKVVTSSVGLVSRVDAGPPC